VLPADHQRLVDQPREQVEQRLLVDPVARADVLHRVQAEAAGEHRQAVQQAALGLLQQRVGPVDRGAQGALARRHAVVGGRAAQ